MSATNNKVISKQYTNEQFDRILSGKEKRALIDSKLVATYILGNNKADN
jgi:hypothetical protein